MLRPRVSIGMPVYNGAQYLEAAIDSLLGQTFTEFELIICDNASTDGTQAICERYRLQDSRIRYERNARNMGASWNFNRTYNLARAQYFKQAAHDDICEPEFLERCVEVLDGDPTVVMAYPRTTIIDADGNTIEHCSETLNLREDRPHQRFQHFHHVFGEWSVCHPVFGVMRVAPVRDREILPRFIASDMILLAELSLHGKIVEIPGSLFKLRWHAGASTVAQKAFEQRALWFDPALSGALASTLTRFRWLYEYLAMIARVPMTPFERLRCYQQMPRWIFRNRSKLATDLLRAASIVHRLHRLRSPKEAINL